MHSKGFFITIEGIDGCGKTLLSTKLKEALEEKGSQVLLTKEPGGSSLGKKLREILHKRDEDFSPMAEYLLFAADRAHHFESIVIPSLEKGMVVISDRCADSSLAYQGFGQGVDKEMIQRVNTWAMQNVQPNLTLYLQLDFDTALQRMVASREELTSIEKRKAEFWKRVYDGFETIFANRDNVATIDAKQSREEVFEQALNVVLKKL